MGSPSLSFRARDRTLGPHSSRPDLQGHGRPLDGIFEAQGVGDALPLTGGHLARGLQAGEDSDGGQYQNSEGGLA